MLYNISHTEIIDKGQKMNSLLNQPLQPSPVRQIPDGPKEKKEHGPVESLLTSIFLHAVGAGFLAELIEAANCWEEFRGPAITMSPDTININPVAQLDPARAFLPK